MIELKLTFATLDDAHAALGLLSGLSVASVATEKPKKETPKQKADAATKDGFEDAAPKTTAAAKAKPEGKKGKVKEVTVEEVKDAILEHAPEGEDQPAAIKEYVRSFGVAKITDMTQAQRIEAINGAEEYFGGEAEGEEDDEDAMS